MPYPAAAVPACIVLMLCVAVPATAQDPPPPPQAQRERMLEKLRQRAAGERPDTAAADSAAAADSLAKSAVPQLGPGAAGGRDAAGLGSFARDSVMEALAGLRGFTVMEYTAAGARFQVDSGLVELAGKAEVLREGRSLAADSLLTYNERTGWMCGYGAPVLSGDGSPVESEEVCYDVNRQVGRALGAKTTFSQGANWIVHGDVYPVGNDRLFGKHVSFTDCDLEEPHYHFAARDLKIVNDNVLVARDVTLNFGDVPVFWLPFMVQSLKQGRRTGLLAPRFGVNDIARTSSGYNRHISDVGFYWAISDHLGAQVALDWFSGNWTAINGSLDYRWLRQFLNGHVTAQQFWKAEGGRELTLSTSNSWQPTERTSVRVDGRYASSSDFVRQRSSNPLELRRTIDSNAGLSHRFDWGSLNVTANRRQHLNATEQVDLLLPSVGLNLSNVTFFRAPPSEARWYNNINWSGSGSVQLRSRSVGDTVSSVRGQNVVDASLNSRLNLGDLSWGQNLSASRTIDHAQFDPDPGDEEPGAPRALTERIDWSSNLSYSQRLVGTSTFSPGLRLRRSFQRTAASDDELVASPMRLDFDASLRTEVYGFWPGVGPFSRIRHKLTPQIGYAYSPAPTFTERQEQVFGSANVREQNRITFSVSQTFEAKRRDDERTQEARDSADAAGAGDEAGAADAGPRELPQARAITLLSLNTSALVYDFVRAREEGAGLETTQINTTVASDLLRGLQLGFRHDLFRPDSAVASGRAFAPHLSNVNASFSIGSESWFAKLLGLGGRRDEPRPEAEAAPDSIAEAERAEGAAPVDMRRRSLAPGMTGGGMQRSSFRGSPGTWNASISYSLIRPRPAIGTGSTGTESQTAQATISFQPTEHWSVHWNTAYSLTDAEFSDHILRLTRNLHDWEANFDFVKAQNGNFSFQVLVQLRANPDIKLDYEQRGDGPRSNFR